MNSKKTNKISHCKEESLQIKHLAYRVPCVHNRRDLPAIGITVNRMLLIHTQRNHVFARYVDLNPL